MERGIDSKSVRRGQVFWSDSAVNVDAGAEQVRQNIVALVAHRAMRERHGLRIGCASSKAQPSIALTPPESSALANRLFAQLANRHRRGLAGQHRVHSRSNQHHQPE